jgi:putative tryptophan/tyrosine transport system substrate-binding protein
MIRRIVVSCVLLAVILLTGSLAETQQARSVWKIGVFHVGLDHVPPSLEPLRQELKKLGYDEGKTLRLDWRNLPDEQAARTTAREFVRDREDLIVAYENQTVRAAMAATSDIPIVFVAVTDPVAEGFVKSFAHPGGNVTGFATWGELYGKEIELFKEIVPRLRRLLVLIDSHDPGTERAKAEVRKTGAALKVIPVEREVANEGDAERLFRSLKPGEADGVFIASPNLRNKFPSLIVSLSSEGRLPLAMHRKEWVEKGALFSYGYTPTQYALAGAAYIDKILKGTKAGDLPVQQPPQLEFVINLKTAKRIGLTIPQAVLYRADKVIR